MDLTCTILMLSLTLSGVTSFCSTGRIFVGNFNASYPEAVRFNGIYKARPDAEATLSHGLPVYQHEQRPNQFVYRTIIGETGGQVLSHWEIGLSVDERLTGELTDVVLVSVPVAGTSDVTSSSVQWLIRADSKHEQWKIAGRSMRVECVNDAFVTCTSGRVILSGMGSRHRNVQGRRMGRFIMTSCTHQMRPVYRHEIINDYLFYTDGAWVVGPIIGRISGGMFVLDDAWRPEYILNDWQVFMTPIRRFERTSGLRVSCDNDALAINSRSDHSTTDINVERHISNSRTPSHSHPGLGRSVLTSCHQSPTNGKARIAECNACQCEQSNCGNTVRCGHPPVMQLLTSSRPTSFMSVASTGSSYLDVVFYRCSPNGATSVPGAEVFVGRVCQLNGTWSDPYPSCPTIQDDSILVAPEHPRLVQRRAYPQRLLDIRSRV